MLWFNVFLCFKQKTAYDMRISDWSADVCSSDLAGMNISNRWTGLGWTTPTQSSQAGVISHGNGGPWLDVDQYDLDAWWVNSFTVNRSEEHTSELQSLMRNSYAVFSLHKKINEHYRTN